jgi:hypothetical protein
MLDMNEINPRTGKTPYSKDNREHKIEYQRKYSQRQKAKKVLQYLGSEPSDNKIQELQESGKLNSILVLNRNQEQDGVVYAITNPAFDGWVKIGRAHDGLNRFNDYQTYSPHRDYKLEYMSGRFGNRAVAEKAVHIIAKQVAQQHSKYDNGEWFKISVQDAINVIKGVETNDAQTTKD